MRGAAVASVITHGLAAVIIGKSFIHEKQSARFWCLLISCSLLPDIDVVGFKIGIAYGDFWGHRGFTHSLVFALITGFTVGLACYHRLGINSPRWWRYVALFSCVTASHGVFDAMTNGGLGIAFLAPFDNTRYFFSWTPVEVTRVGFHNFISYKGISILLSETVYILAPMALLAAILFWIRKRNEKAGSITSR